MKRNPMEYVGTAAWYAYNIILKASVRDNLYAAARKREFSKDEKNEILCIAVNECKSCAMAKKAADVALTALCNGIITQVIAASDAGIIEEITECYISQTAEEIDECCYGFTNNPFFASKEEIEKEFFAFKE